MEACAIGRSRPNGPWIGFAADPTGYRFVAGDDRGERSRPADAALLLALAIAYFEEAFEDAPSDREATHADLSALVRHVAASNDRPELRMALAEAVDAIDDGLPGMRLPAASARPGPRQQTSRPTRSTCSRPSPRSC